MSDEKQLDLDEPACRVCGCTENAACPGGCWWVPDPELAGELCSACVEDLVDDVDDGCPWCDDEGCVYCTLRPTELVVVRSGVL